MKKIHLNTTWISILDVLDDSDIIRFIGLVMGRNYDSLYFEDIIFIDNFGRTGYLTVRGLS